MINYLLNNISLKRTPLPPVVWCFTSPGRAHPARGCGDVRRHPVADPEDVLGPLGGRRGGGSATAIVFDLGRHRRGDGRRPAVGVADAGGAEGSAAKGGQRELQQRHQEHAMPGSVLGGSSKASFTWKPLALPRRRDQTDATTDARVYILQLDRISINI